MKNLILLLSLLVLGGCAEKIQDYLDEPQTFIADPHFAEYQQKRDELESQYLKKEITLSQYQEKLGELDNTYNKEVQEREEKISSPQ